MTTRHQKDDKSPQPPAAAIHERAGGDATSRILAAAEKLFAEHGFEAVSMNDIAERAEVSKANIFHHFESKHALYIAVLRAACQNSADRLHRIGTEPGSFVEQLASFAEHHLAGMIEHEQIFRLIKRELLDDGERRGRELAEKVFGDNFARFVDILRNGQARGELRRDIDPALAALMLVGINVFFFDSREVLRHFRDITFSDNPAQFSRMMMDVILRGLTTPPQTQNNVEP
jgi:TetR/AcrR family transcriptional regulator